MADYRFGIDSKENVEGQGIFKWNCSQREREELAKAHRVGTRMGEQNNLVNLSYQQIIVFFPLV